ncbi:MAG: hypothetical protein P4L46_22725 [Fimbriimonas sp.]|nr:hypothetical protein [Fimbriimonas sp.]
MVQLAVLAAFPLSLLGHDVGVRLIRSNGEVVQEFLARDSHGQFQKVLLSPTHPEVKRQKGAKRASAVGVPTVGLYAEPPTFLFTEADVDEAARTIRLKGGGVNADVVETITIPETGNLIDVKLATHFKSANPILDHLMATFVFAPGKPDTTWTPGLRSRPEQVIGDHFFRSPAVLAQRGAIAAALMPDLDVLAGNRPMPTIVDLNCSSGFCSQPLLGYGFCDYRVSAHVAFSHDASMARPVPPDLLLGFQLRLDAEAKPFAGYQPVSELMWDKYGHGYLDKILPQAVPFEDYAKFCYPAAFEEKDTGGWFEQTIDGNVCGGLPSGWGLGEGWVSWQAWFCQIRSAWGLRWWGKRLGKTDWVEKGEKMLNLALAAPMKDGACPTTFESKTGQWRGTLVAPSKDCYYDLTNIAWKGIQLLRWLRLPDCPRREEIQRQVDAMSDMLVAKQNKDGSWPSWLDRDLKPVPILDRSAQSALPDWFLAEWCKVSSSQPSRPAKLRAALRGADFLAESVVDQQRYYDFETFFSCSPKTCLQRDYRLDDAAMMDPFTMQRPQNTLSMQWSAEALRAAHALAPANARYMTQALKALDMMCLYQEVWPISFIKTAYVYGGFGVQNSDGEFNDARQAQFGETLCSFGVELGRQDLFERGVAATRATLALINHPLHQELGIYPNPNYPPGLEPENCGHGGTDEQNGRSGFDWAEGSGLTSMAGLLDSYGTIYHSAAGWSVLIDGVEKGSRLVPPPLPAPATDPSFDFSAESAPGWSFNGDFLNWPHLSKRLNFGNKNLPFIGTSEDGRNGYDDRYTGLVVSPRFATSHLKIRMLVGGGSGDGVYVELVDDAGKRLFVERGKNSEFMDERVWDISKLTGIPLRIRIVDKEQGPWGHINVGDIRLTD